MVFVIHWMIDRIHWHESAMDLHVFPILIPPLKEVLKAQAGKWTRQVSTLQRISQRERKNEKERVARRPKYLGEQGYFISRNARLYIWVKWLLSHYEEWNSISCNKMDSLIHTRPLVLKKVTEGSYWKKSKEVPFPMISVLRTACSSTRSWNRNWKGTENPWEMAHRGRHVQHIGFLKVECPLTLMYNPWLKITVFAKPSHMLSSSTSKLNATDNITREIVLQSHELERASDTTKACSCYSLSRVLPKLVFKTLLDSIQTC